MQGQIQPARHSFDCVFTGAVEAAQALAKGELLKLSGVAIPLGKVSVNGRRYIPETVHSQVAALQDRIAAKALFGVLDHPPVTDIAQLAYVKMTDVSHRIDRLWYNEADNSYHVDVTVLDTPNGRILKSINDSGSPLYISLRSLLDPQRNIQHKTHTDAFMIALITLDFVSQPGFADAELKPVNVANESALAVFDALNVTNLTNMTNNQAYVPTYAAESFNGVSAQPTKDFGDLVTSFLAEAIDKLGTNFTASDFAEAWPDSVYDHSIVGLYEDLKQIIVKNNEQFAIIQLNSDIDGQYTIADGQTVAYFIEESRGTAATPTETEAKPATESEDGSVVLQTEGEQPESVSDEEPVTEPGDMYNIEPETAATEDPEGEQQQGELNEAMYTIVEDDNATVEEPEGNADPEEPEATPTEDPENPAAIVDNNLTEDAAELAQEAAAIFSMPNSRFAGNYAIEHMPTAFKHIWASLSEAAKNVVAMQAARQSIATESASLKFWHSTNFVAIESACILNGGAIEAAMESATLASPEKQAKDYRTQFMQKCFGK